MKTHERLYREAYDLQYKKSNPEKALSIYNEIVRLFPDSKEAEYAKTQIKNIEQLTPYEIRKIAARSLEQNPDDILLSTTNELSNYRIIKHIGIVSSECAFGMHILEDLFVALTDFFGGRSQTTQDTLKAAKDFCLKEIQREALNLGANAVVGIRLNYSEFSGKMKSMLFIATTGTAVIVEEIASDQLVQETQCATK